MMNNYQDCWSKLGIEPTDQRNIIRRAYSQLLKTTRPESDPEGYENLRQAYESCLNQIEDKSETIVVDRSATEAHSELKDNIYNTYQNPIIYTEAPEQALEPIESEDNQVTNWIDSIIDKLNACHQAAAIEAFEKQKHLLLTLTPSSYFQGQVDLISRLNDLDPAMLYPRKFYNHIVDFFRWECDFKLKKSLNKYGLSELHEKIKEYELGLPASTTISDVKEIAGYGLKIAMYILKFLILLIPSYIIILAIYYFL